MVDSEQSSYPYWEPGDLDEADPKRGIRVHPFFMILEALKPRYNDKSRQRVVPISVASDVLGRISDCDSDCFQAERLAFIAEVMCILTLERERRSSRTEKNFTKTLAKLKDAVEEAERLLAQAFDASFDPEFYGREHQFGRIVHARVLIQAAYFGALPNSLRIQQTRDLIDFSFNLNDKNELEWSFDNGFTSFLRQMDSLSTKREKGWFEFEVESKVGATDLESLATPYIIQLASIFSCACGEKATAWETVKYNGRKRKPLKSKFLYFLDEVCESVESYTRIPVSSIMPGSNRIASILKSVTK